MNARAELLLSPPAGGEPALLRGQGRLPPLWALLMAVCLAPLALLVTVLAGSQDIAVGGDQAVIELAIREAASADRTLGPYSRYGWSHPGPFWYYLLAVPYQLLGSSSTALYLSAGLLHLVVAGLVVLTVDRWMGRLSALVAASGVVLAQLVLGAEVFRTVWNPYALLLPTALFLVLAAAAANGSAVGLAAAALVATFLVQTHISAALPVAAVAAITAVTFLVVRCRAAERLPPRRELTVAGALLLATALIWIPPVVQEQRPGMGNAAQMRLFAERELPGQPWEQAWATVGSELLVLPSLGRAPEPPEAAAALDPSELTALAGFVFIGLALVVIGARRRRGHATALAGLSVVCMLTSVVAVTSVDGVIFPYLVVWQSILPLALVVAAAGLSNPGPREGSPLRRVAGSGVTAVVAAVLVAAAAVAQAVAAPPLADDMSASVAAAVAKVVPSLPPPEQGAVRVRIGSGGAWPVAAGVILALERRGYDTRVTPDWVFMFGGDLASTNAERTEVLLIQQPQLSQLPRLDGVRDLGRVKGPEGVVHLGVRQAEAGRAVPPLAGPITGVLLPS